MTGTGLRMAHFLLVSTAAAQPPALPSPIAEISVDVALARHLGADCSATDGAVLVVLASCSPFRGSAGGSVGFPMRRGRIVPFLAISLGRTVLDTALLVRGRGPGSLGAAVEISGTGTAVSGGARFYFQPRGRRVRGFLSVASGYGRVVADLSIYDGWSRGRVSTPPVHAPLYGGPALSSTVGSVAILSDLGVDLRVTDPVPPGSQAGCLSGFQTAV